MKKVILLLIVSLLFIASPVVTLADEIDDLRIELLQEKQKTLKMEFDYVKERMKNIQTEFSALDKQVIDLIAKRDAELKKKAEEAKKNQIEKDDK